MVFWFAACLAITFLHVQELVLCTVVSSIVCSRRCLFNCCGEVKKEKERGGTRVRCTMSGCRRERARIEEKENIQRRRKLSLFRSLLLLPSSRHLMSDSESLGNAESKEGTKELLSLVFCCLLIVSRCPDHQHLDLSLLVRRQHALRQRERESRRLSRLFVKVSQACDGHGRVVTEGQKRKKRRRR